MGLAKVVHVDVVTNAGSVGSGVVIAENFHGGAPTLHSFENQRNEMRLGFVQFADRTALIRSGSVEVAKADVFQAISATIGLEGQFEGELGCAVGIHRLTRSLFRDWHPDRIPIYCARRRKNTL